MSSNGHRGYKLRHLPAAAQQINDLAKIAAGRGLKTLLLASLTEVVGRLQSEPSSWGDPQYNLHKPGACMYSGILDPVIVNYVVFEHEKIVLVVKVRPLPNSGLD